MLRNVTLPYASPITIRRHSHHCSCHETYLLDFHETFPILRGMHCSTEDNSTMVCFSSLLLFNESGCVYACHPSIMFSMDPLIVFCTMYCTLDVDNGHNYQSELHPLAAYSEPSSANAYTDYPKQQRYLILLCAVSTVKHNLWSVALFSSINPERR